MKYGKEYYEGKGSQYASGYDAAKGNLRILADNLARMFDFESSLEVGCAKGFVVERLIELGKRSHGFDISQWAVENSAVKNQIVKGDAGGVWPSTLPVDLVYSTDVMEHLERDAAFRCIESCFKKAKKYVVHWISTCVDKNLGDASKIRDVDPTHISMYTPEWWSWAFRCRMPEGWWLQMYVPNKWIVLGDGERFNTTIFVASKEPMEVL